MTKEKTALDRVNNPLGALVQITRRQEGLERAAENKVQVKKLAIALFQFVESDMKFQHGLVDVGAVYYHFLNLPIETQQRVTTQMAEERGIEPPSYDTEDGRRNGRAQLLAVLYAPWPEMLKPEKGKKDSVAGKRLSEAMRKYKQKAGLLAVKKVSERTRKAKKMEHLLRKTFPILLSACRGKAEEEALLKVFVRAGVPKEMVAELTEGEAA